MFSPPIIRQPPEAPQETKEAKQTAAEVKVDTNGNEEQNGHPDAKKKKLNKRERKEARQQKDRKAVKTVAQDIEDDQAGKKGRKRKNRCEEDGDEEQNGHSAENETSSKKIKTSKTFSKCVPAICSWILISLWYYIVSFTMKLFGQKM